MIGDFYSVIRSNAEICEYLGSSVVGNKFSAFYAQINGPVS